MDEAPINILPNEIWNKIFECLPIENIFNVSRVCRKLYEIAHSFNNYKKSILKEQFNNIKYCKDYLTFIPLCNNGMKLFKYVKLWDNIPIHFDIINEISNYLNIENLLLNYISRCSNIFQLTITTCFDNSTIDTLEKNLPSTVKKLNLKNTVMSDIIITYNSKNIQNVKYLELNHINLSENSNFEHINSLYLVNIYITNVSENIKIQLSNIDSLNIIHPRTIFDDVSFFKKTKQLSYTLDKGIANINQNTIKMISENKNLIKCSLNTLVDTSYLNLSILGNSNLEYLTINYFGKYILNLNGLERIKYVNLSGVRISNIHNTMFNKVLNLSNCNIKQHMVPKLLNVEKLDLSRNFKIRDTSIFSSEESKIKVLDLSYNEHIKYIDNLSNLEELSVIGCNDFIYCINNLNMLKNIKLYIDFCSCDKCIELYKFNTQIRMNYKKSFIKRCKYKYKYNWFNF